MPEKRVIPQKLNKPKKRKTKRATKKTHTKRASSATSKAKKQRAHSAALTKSHAARSYNSLAQRFDDFYLFLKKRKKSGKNIGEILKGRKRECPIKYFKEFTNGNFPKKHPNTTWIYLTTDAITIKYGSPIWHLEGHLKEYRI